MTLDEYKTKHPADWPWKVFDRAQAFVRAHEKRGHKNLEKIKELIALMAEYSGDGMEIKQTAFATQMLSFLNPPEEVAPLKTPPPLADLIGEAPAHDTAPAIDPRLEILKDLAQHMWKGDHAERLPKKPATWTHEPLKHKHLHEHLRAGGTGCGLAPIIPGTDTTRAALFDLDAHKGEIPWSQMQANAKLLLQAARRVGVNLMPFRSSGGTGMHLLALWKTPQDSHTVREILRRALAAAGLDPKTEIFPKQSSVPTGGYGNMFVMPFNGASCALDRKTFKDITPEQCQLRYSWPLKKIERPVIEHNSTTPAPLDTEELKRLQQALQVIPNEGDALDYDSWRDIVFSIHHASGGSDAGLRLALEFSRRSPKHDEEFFTSSVWPYIKSERENPITAATIFAKAREHGFDDALSFFEDISNQQTEAQEVTPTQQAPRFRIEDPVEFCNHPEPRWLVWRVLPASELVIVYGESTAGKSFIALDIACAIVRGIPWRESHVEQGRVVYVCAEGAGDFQLRIEAYCKASMIEPSDLRPGLGILPAAPNLYLVDDVKALIQALHAFGRVDVIFIDTLARTSSGANENSAEDMNRVLAHCQAIHRATGALVVLVHHSGKDLSKEIRGSSAIKGAADAVLEIVLSNTGARVVRISKLKGGRDGANYPFQLKVVQLRENERGEVIDSCIVEHLAEKQERPSRQPKGAMQVRVYKALCAAQGRLPDGAVEVQSLIEDISRSLIPPEEGKRDLRKQNVRDALDKLVAAGFLRHIEEGWVVPVGVSDSTEGEGVGE